MCAVFLRTLVGDLKHRPQHLMLLSALMRRVLCILHLVGEFQERVFNVVKSLRWGFAVFGAADGRHI